MGECPQPCEHLSQEDAREGRTCSEHPCSCDGEREALADRLFAFAQGASMSDLKNGQTDALLMAVAVLRRTEALEPPTREAWRNSIVDERRQQPSRGYTSDHDREHGLDHLLEWAQEYARIGEPLKSAALIEAARDLHRASEAPEPSATWAHCSPALRATAPEPQGEPTERHTFETDACVTRECNCVQGEPSDAQRYRAAIEDALPMIGLMRAWNTSPEQIANVRAILARALGAAGGAR